MTQNNESVEAVALDEQVRAILLREVYWNQDDGLRGIAEAARQIAALAATPREPSYNAHTDLIAELDKVYNALTPGAFESADLDGMAFTVADAMTALQTSAKPGPIAREQAVMVCPQCEGEGGYPDGIDEDACHTDCTRCGSNGWIVDLAADALQALHVTASERPVCWIDILREWFGGERYARDYEYLDKNYAEQARRVEAFLNARTALTEDKGE